MSALPTTTLLPGPRGRGRRPTARRSLVGFLFAVPALALFLLFAIYPGVQVFGLSLFDYSLTSPPEFVGIKNFAFLSTDPRFGEALDPDRLLRDRHLRPRPRCWRSCSRRRSAPASAGWGSCDSSTSCRSR